jgi:hypothetical protein
MRIRTAPALLLLGSVVLVACDRTAEEPLGPVQPEGTASEPKPTPEPDAGSNVVPAHKDVSVTLSSHCALWDGVLGCWGSDSDGLLTTTASKLTTDDALTPPGLGGSMRLLDAHRGGLACVAHEDGKVTCWSGATRAAREMPLDATGARALASLYDDVCVLDASGQVRCAGVARYKYEVQLPELAVSLVSNQGAMCAVLQSGTVYCWGGFYTGSRSLQTPTPIHFRRPVKQLTVGGWGGCALLDDATVQCFGSDDVGQLGDGWKPTSLFQPDGVDVVELGGPVAEVIAGNIATCARLVDGRVQCWGTGQWGALGVSSNTLSMCTVGNDNYSCSRVPVTVPNLAQAAVKLGDGCALLKDGSLHCWESRPYGNMVPDFWTVRPPSAPMP